MQAKAAPDAATGDGVIQRVRIGLVNGNITASHIRRSRRVAGGLRNGGQGDHTTAYLSMQHMIVNAVNNLAPGDAHDNLIDTHLAMMNFPGYARSPQWLRNQSQNRFLLEQARQGGAITLAQIRDYGTFLLQLRNRMALSSLPTTGGSTGNHAEQRHGGGLQQEEQRLQNGHAPRYTRQDILISMVALCDTRRIRRSVHNVNRQDEIAVQHGLSMVQSYPTICQQYGITAQNVTGRVIAAL